MKKKEIVESLVGLVAKQHEHMDTLLKAMAKHIPVKADRDTFFEELSLASGDIKAACKRVAGGVRKEQVQADKVLDAVVTEEPLEVCRHLTAVAEITSLVLRKEFNGARLMLKEFLQSGVSQAYLDALIIRFGTWGSMGVLCIQLMEYPQVQTDKTEMMVARALTYADELADQLNELGVELPMEDHTKGRPFDGLTEAVELAGKTSALIKPVEKPFVTVSAETRQFLTVLSDVTSLTLRGEYEEAHNVFSALDKAPENVSRIIPSLDSLALALLRVQYNTLDGVNHVLKDNHKAAIECANKVAGQLKEFDVKIAIFTNVHSEGHHLTCSGGITLRSSIEDVYRTLDHTKGSYISDVIRGAFVTPHLPKEEAVNV